MLTGDLIQMIDIECLSLFSKRARYACEHDWKIIDNRENQREANLYGCAIIWKIPGIEGKKRRIHMRISCMCHLYSMIERTKTEISNNDE